MYIYDLPVDPYDKNYEKSKQVTISMNEKKEALNGKVGSIGSINTAMQKQQRWLYPATQEVSSPYPPSTDTPHTSTTQAISSTESPRSDSVPRP